MQRLFRCFAVLVTLIIVGCASQPPSLRDQHANTPSSPITIQTAFLKALPLAQGRKLDISVIHGEVPLVAIGDRNVLAVPITIEYQESKRVIVRSRVVRKSNGAYVLFYPIVSIVDDNFSVTKTIKPNYEFKFSESDNTLSNEFDLPAGARNLLIHTTDEYVRGSFTGATIASDNLSGSAAAGVFGGLIGAVAFLASNSGSDSYQTESNQYRLGDVGMIEVGLEASNR